VTPLASRAGKPPSPLPVEVQDALRGAAKPLISVLEDALGLSDPSSSSFAPSVVPSLRAESDEALPSAPRANQVYASSTSTSVRAARAAADRQSSTAPAAMRSTEGRSDCQARSAPPAYRQADGASASSSSSSHGAADAAAADYQASLGGGSGGRGGDSKASSGEHGNVSGESVLARWCIEIGMKYRKQAIDMAERFVSDIQRRAALVAHHGGEAEGGAAGGGGGLEAKEDDWPLLDHCKVSEYMPHVSSGEGGSLLVPLLQLPVYGEVKTLCKDALSMARCDASGSAGQVLVLAQASGTGKTKVFYLWALEGRIVILIRTTTTKDGLPSKPWLCLEQCLNQLSDPDSSTKDARARNLVRRLFGCYVLWARTVLRAFLQECRERGVAATSCDIAVSVLLAVRNGLGDMAVHELFKAAVVCSLGGRSLSWTDAHARALSADAGQSAMPIFAVDEAHILHGAHKGTFLHSARESGARVPADLFHGMARCCDELVGEGIIAAMAGTDPHLPEYVGEVSTAQGGFCVLPITTHITTANMQDSLRNCLRRELVFTEEIVASLRLLEGRAANFFGGGLHSVIRAIARCEHGADVTPVVAKTLRAAVQKRADVFDRVVSVFLTAVEHTRGADLARSVQNRVLRAVLWNDASLAKEGSQWDTNLVASGLAATDDAVATLDLGSEPLLLEALWKTLTDASKLRNGTGYAAFLRDRVSGDGKGLAWEELLALTMVTKVRCNPLGDALVWTHVLPPAPSGFEWPLHLSTAVRRTVSARAEMLDVLFAADGSPNLDVLAVNVNQFLGPDLMFFGFGVDVVTHQRLEPRLVLVQARTVKSGSVVDAVKTVTLGRLVRDKEQQPDRARDQDTDSHGKTSSLRRAREHVQAMSSAIASYLESAIRVVAYPYTFPPDVVESINAYNRLNPDHPIVLVGNYTKDDVHESVLGAAVSTNAVPAPALDLVAARAPGIGSMPHLTLGDARELCHVSICFPEQSADAALVADMPGGVAKPPARHTSFHVQAPTAKRVLQLATVDVLKRVFNALRECDEGERAATPKTKEPLVARVLQMLLQKLGSEEQQVDAEALRAEALMQVQRAEHERAAKAAAQQSGARPSGNGAGTKRPRGSAEEQRGKKARKEE